MPRTVAAATPSGVVEEGWLVEAHPDYEEYRARVRRGSLPFVW